MQAWIIDLMGRFGYFAIAFLIAIENIFPPIPSEIILTFGGFMTTYTSMNVFLVILFSTIGSVLGALVLYGVGRLVSIERIEKWLHGRLGRILHLKPEDVHKAQLWFDKRGKLTVFEWVGAKGLFVSMIVSLTVSNLYAFFVNKGFTIKMPKEVPEVVGDSFLSLFPCIFVASIFLLLNYLMSLTIFESLHECIYKVLQTPLTSLGNSLPAICIFTLLTTLLWWIGIHGGQIVGTFTNPIFIPLALENLSAFNNQSELPHVYTHAFNNVYLFGGSGMTISLCILMAFFSKSKQFKALGRLTLPSNFFHINEPLLFSLPIMFNPIMFIPFMSAPLISVIIAYVATDLGLVPRIISYQFPWTMPPFLSGYLQGGIKVMLLQVVLLFITFLIYLPFFKIMDNKQQSDRENYTV